MSLQPDARHGMRRPHVATRLIALRAIGLGVGFLISVPIVALLFALA